MTQSRLELLRNAVFPHTEILEVTYEDSGSYLHMTGLPPFVRVLWKNAFGEDSKIFTEIWLPDNWDGIFVALGNGGMAGSLVRDVLVSHVQKGRAAVHTDMGTSGGRNRGIGNPTLWADFGWRSTHMMAEIGKQIIALWYGKAPDYSYFVGGSTGGHQAMSMAQRFPCDYDGILAAVPASNRIYLHTYMLWNHNHLRLPDGTKRFTDEEIPKITAAATKFFQKEGDGTPGDNFITYPWRGEDTVSRFLAFLAKEEPTFTSAQLEALRAVYEGPRDPVTGRQIYNGLPIGAEIFGCGIRDYQNAETPFFDPFVWVFGEGYTGYDFDFSADLEKLGDLLAADMNANNPDLSPFAAHGGKLLVYSASADPCVPYPDAMKYCERVQKLLGGYETVSDFYRWFLMPGMDHGNGGRGVNEVWWQMEGEHDLFLALRKWREEGVAPESIVGARVVDGKREFARVMYPYGSEKFPLRDGVPTCDEYYLAK